MRARIVTLAIVALATHAGRARAEHAMPRARAAQAPFVRQEPYLTSGFGFFSSDRRVLAGVGGGPGFRLDVGRHFAAYAEARWLVYTGNSFTGALGLLYRVRIASWEPVI